MYIFSLITDSFQTRAILTVECGPAHQVCIVEVEGHGQVEVLLYECSGFLRDTQVQAGLRHR